MSDQTPSLVKEAWIFVEDGPPIPLGECDPGTLFRHGKDTLALLSDYGQDEAHILGNGEVFWGGTKTLSERSRLVVQPLRLAKVMGVDWGMNSGSASAETVFRRLEDGRVEVAAVQVTRYPAPDGIQLREFPEDPSFARICWETPTITTDGRCECPLEGAPCTEGFGSYAECPRSTSPDAPRGGFITVDTVKYPFAFGIAPIAMHRAGDAAYHRAAGVVRRRARLPAGAGHHVASADLGSGSAVGGQGTRRSLPDPDPPAACLPAALRHLHPDDSHRHQRPREARFGGSGAAPLRLRPADRCNRTMNIPNTLDDPRVRTGLRLAAGDVAPGAVFIPRELLQSQAVEVLIELLEVLGVPQYPGSHPLDREPTERTAAVLVREAFTVIEASPAVDAVILEPERGSWNLLPVKVRPNGRYLLLIVPIQAPNV